MNNKQYKKGFIAPIVLIMSLCTIAMTVFVIESGRMIETRSALDNGVELAVRGGVQQYGKSLEEKTKEIFEEEKEAAEEYVDKKIIEEGLILTEEERSDMIKEKQRELTLERKEEITAHARSRCTSTASDLLKKNDVIQTKVTCTDTEVSISGTRRYSQIITGGTTFGAKTFEQALTEKIILQQ